MELIDPADIRPASFGRPSAEMTQGSETAQSKSEEVTISQYILTRLEQVRKDVIVRDAHKSKLSVLRSASGISSEYQVSRHAVSSKIIV